VGSQRVKKIIIIKKKTMYEGKLEFPWGKWGHRAKPLVWVGYTLYLGLQVEDPQARGRTH